ncbi:MAG: flagellar type III secretion system pore protein FliP [Phycisphaerae bacterium]|nr:flagellar type III secretion system pore protein FliP [Phycisphaerae bacterium]
MTCLRACILLLCFSLAPLAAASIGPRADEPTSAAARPIDDPILNPLSVLESAGQAVVPSPGGGSRGGLSTALNIMIVLTVVTLAPSIILMTTCFMRVLIVLGLVKQALGASTVPPPQVITALTLFITLIVMAPTLDRINAEAVAPYRAGEIRDYDELWARARQPVRDFMFDQIEAGGNWSSLYMILERRGIDTSEPERLTRADVDMISLIPAYMLSELRTAFLMGFKVYLPFLVIDMVISTMLISMGMMMLPPVLVSLPFKILLFVLVDGWALVCGGLISSFAHKGELALHRAHLLLALT